MGYIWDRGPRAKWNSGLHENHWVVSWKCFCDMTSCSWDNTQKNNHRATREKGTLRYTQSHASGPITTYVLCYRTADSASTAVASGLRRSFKFLTVCDEVFDQGQTWNCRLACWHPKGVNILIWPNIAHRQSVFLQLRLNDSVSAHFAELIIMFGSYRLLEAECLRCLTG